MWAISASFFDPYSVLSSAVFDQETPRFIISSFGQVAQLSSRTVNVDTKAMEAETKPGSTIVIIFFVPFGGCILYSHIR
jgi:hypothetical protein